MLRCRKQIIKSIIQQTALPNQQLNEHTHFLPSYWSHAPFGDEDDQQVCLFCLYPAQAQSSAQSVQY